jgi:hypothetical protein
VKETSKSECRKRRRGPKLTQKLEFELANPKRARLIQLIFDQSRIVSDFEFRICDFVHAWRVLQPGGDQCVMFVQSRSRTASAIATIDFRGLAVYG